MKTLKNIKAIIFDAYGTLFDVNSAAEKCKDKIGDKWEGFANYWRTTQLEYTWLRSLMKRHKNFWQITEDSLDKSMKAFEINSSMRNELLDLYKILSPFKEVPEVLISLKEKDLKLAILSNGTPALLNQLVKSNNLDNLFDVNSAAEKCKDKIGDKWEGFANYWRTTQLEYTWLRSLMKRHKDFWQVTEDSLDKSMKAYEIDSSMRNELLDLYKILSPFREVPEVLKLLKEKNLKLAIL